MSAKPPSRQSLPKPVDTLLDKIGRWIAARLHAPSSGYEPFTASDPKTLNECLQPGDILLVEGNQKISAAIKYLTQSTWSHAALFVGDKVHEFTPEGERHRLIEVNLGQGCVSVPLSKYENFNTRICRPVGLTKEDRKTVVTYMVDRIGLKYDLKNILDLMRYLLPTPPIPNQYRRKMLVLGSGDPTRAICSTLIAEAFQSIKYPILPTFTDDVEVDQRTLQLRHHTLFVPRDFDISPYFNILKPEIYKGFDHSSLKWRGN
ncbi:MAG: lipo-like protein [Piscirickettsiaceae bacterium]|nr:MAG: lipo-like protein [Piscirickettsiaceae bacterium]